MGCIEPELTISSYRKFMFELVSQEAKYLTGLGDQSQPTDITLTDKTPHNF